MDTNLQQTGVLLNVLEVNLLYFRIVKRGQKGIRLNQNPCFNIDEKLFKILYLGSGGFLN